MEDDGLSWDESMSQDKLMRVLGLETTAEKPPIPEPHVDPRIARREEKERAAAAQAAAQSRR